MKKTICRNLPVIGALVLFAILWLSDFPKSCYDDLFYVGAGLNMANGGDLSNPLLVRQGFPSHYFFLYPPLHSYALAGWLELFGISAASLTAFPALMYLVITVGLIAILRKHRAPKKFEWLVPLCVTAAFFPTGLRPESFSVALTLAGFALLECGRSLRYTFPGFALLFLGASASPRIAPFSAALALLCSWQFWSDPAKKNELIKFFPQAGAALGLSVLAFLAMIHFRLREFLAIFHIHTARVSTGKVLMLSNFARDQRLTSWPLWAIFLVLLVIALRRPREPLNQLGLLVALMLPVEAIIADLGPSIMFYMILPALLFAVQLAQSASRRGALLGALTLTLALLFTNLKTAVNAFGALTGAIRPGPRAQRDCPLALQSTPAHPLLICSETARYLYGYRLPPNVVDIGFSAPFPGSWVATTDLKPGDIYLVDINARHGLERDTFLTPLPTRTWNPFHSRLLSFELYPQHIYVIPEEDCHGIRPDAVKP